MKTPLPYLVALCFVIALSHCGKKTDDHGAHHDHDTTAADASPNQILYDQVIGVHNEVMPKMDEIYQLKESLKDKIANNPAMPADKKQVIEATILQLDSASEGMMVWMRKFSPLPDSVGEEKAREYLEDEMVKVQKVKADMLESIEKAKSI